MKRMIFLLGAVLLIAACASPPVVTPPAEEDLVRACMEDPSLTREMCECEARILTEEPPAEQPPGDPTSDDLSYEESKAWAAYILSEFERARQAHSTCRVDR